MERWVFEPSSCVKDPSNLKELEFWGHDGGVFVLQKAEGDLKNDSSKDREKELEEPIQKP